MTEPLPITLNLDKLHAQMANGLDLLVAMITVSDQRADALESQLGQAHAEITRLKAELAALRYERNSGEPPF